MPITATLCESLVSTGTRIRGGRMSATEERRRRILLLAPFAPRHDSAYGTARLIAEQVEALATRHDIALLSLRAAGDPPSDDRVRRSCDVVEEVVRSVTGDSPADRARRYLRPIT